MSMRTKLGIIILFCCVALTSRAQQQYQMFGVALQEFSKSRFLQYEEIPMTWNMEGTLQADLNEGINRLMEHEPGPAEMSFNVVLEKDATLWQAYYFRAVARKQLGRLFEAEQDLRNVVKLNPQSYEGYIELAKVKQMQGLLIASEDAVKKAIRIDKSRPAAYYLRGDINLVKNLGDFATKNYETCLRIDSIFHPARIKLAIIELIVNKNEHSALQHLNKILEYDSTQQSALLFRSILIFETDKQQCKRDLSNLIRVSPNNWMAYFLRGMLLTTLKDYDKAFSDFQRIIKATATNENDFKGLQTWTDKKIDIQNVGAYTLTRVYGLPDEDGEKIKQAYCHIFTMSYDRGIALINQVSDVDFEPLAVYLKAVAHEHKGEHQKAFALYNQALSLDNDIADAHKKRAIYEQEMKQWDKSIVDLTEVLRINPDGFVIYKIRGISHFYNNDFQKAISDFSSYLKYDSTSAEVLGQRGMAYLKSHQRLRAYADFASSNNKQTFDFKDMIHVVDSTLTLGDTTLALYALNCFTKTTPDFTEAYVVKFKIFVARDEWKAIDQEIGRAVVYRRSEASKTDYAYLLTLQAMHYARQKKGEDALATFEKAIRIDKKNSEAYLERGKLLLAMGKTLKAQEDLEKASSLGNVIAKHLLEKGN